MEIGDHGEAESLYQHALSESRARLDGRRLAVAHTLTDLANVHRVVSKYARAESCLTDALEIHRSLGTEETLGLARRYP